MNPLNFLVVGRGPWGNNIARDLKALSLSPIGSLRTPNVMQVGRDGMLAIMEQQHPPRFDAVFIATPLSTHAALTKWAMKHRIPTWLEKPAFPSVSELENTYAAYPRAAPFYVNYTLLHAWGYNELKWRMVRNHDAPMFIDMALGKKRPPRADCNEVWDWAPHFFSVYFGLAPWVSDVAVKMGQDGRLTVIDVRPVRSTGPEARLTLDTFGAAMRSVQVTGAYCTYDWSDTNTPTVKQWDPRCSGSSLEKHVLLPDNEPSPLQHGLRHFFNKNLDDDIFNTAGWDFTRKVTKALEQLGPPALVKQADPEPFNPDVHGPV